jgi:hypothetical protein
VESHYGSPVLHSLCCQDTWWQEILLTCRAVDPLSFSSPSVMQCHLCSHLPMGKSPQAPAFWDENPSTITSFYSSVSKY